MLKLKSAFLVGLILESISAYGATAPELPRVYVDTSMPTTSITKTVCNSNCDYTNNQLQQAIDDAQLGTTILLQPGVTYTPLDDRGFILTNKVTGSGWIVIQPANAQSGLPPAGTRITPANASTMPKIARSQVGMYALYCDASAHHYRIIGIEFMNPGNVDTARIAAGAFIDCDSHLDTSLSTQAHHIVFDRIYVHGPSAPGALGVKFGVVLGGQHEAVIDSYIEELVSQDGEAKAIGAWFGAGPLKIVNNFLSSAGENIMIGGADPIIANLVPSDIEFRHNHFFKPLKWKDPSYASPSTGYAVGVKNLFELKNAQRVLVDGNVFENIWYPSNQSSFAIMITPRNQEGTAPLTVVQDVTITNNKIIGAANGFAISGFDSNWGIRTTPGGRILFQNNLITNLGTDPSIDTGRGTGKLFMITNGVSDLQIVHNTVASYVPGTAGINFRFTYGVGDEGGLFPLQNLVIQDNLLRVTDAPVIGSAPLSTIAPGAVWTNTVIAGPWPTPLGYLSTSPVPLPSTSGNSYPSDESAIGYSNASGGDYHLATGSPYKDASSDHKDIGVDWILFDAAQDPANNSPPVTSSTPTTSSLGSISSTTSTATTTTLTSKTTKSTDTTTTTIKETSKRFLGKLKQLMDRVR
jgi:hypothetical protein